MLYVIQVIVSRYVTHIPVLFRLIHFIVTNLGRHFEKLQKKFLSRTNSKLTMAGKGLLPHEVQRYAYKQTLPNLKPSDAVPKDMETSGNLNWFGCRIYQVCEF